MDEVIASLTPALESKIGAYRKKYRLPGIAAGLATRDGLRWWHGSGFADLESGRRPDQRTLFRIASISNTFTATAVLQLRDEGWLGLDDPAVRYLPELRRCRIRRAPSRTSPSGGSSCTHLGSRASRRGRAWTGRSIVLLNGMGDADGLARELIDVALPAPREADERTDVSPLAPIPAAWRELLGVYRDPEFGQDAIVEWRDGKLVVLIGGPEAPSHDLQPTDDPLVFTMLGGRQGGEPIVFSRGSDGRIDRCNTGGYPAIRVDLLRRPTGWSTPPATVVAISSAPASGVAMSPVRTDRAVTTGT